MTPQIPLPLTGIVSFAEVCRQLDVADIDQRGRILEFVAGNRSRINPIPDDEWMCHEFVEYYLDSIVRTDSSVEMLNTPFEAAARLVDLVNWWLVKEDGGERVAELAIRMAGLYRISSPEIQNRIETGFLEHVLETPSARPMFAFWAEDPILAESHRAALEWGLAHSAEEAQ